MIENKDELRAELEYLISGILDTKPLVDKLKKHEAIRDGYYDKIQALIKKNATVAMDPDEYDKEIAALQDEYTKTIEICNWLEDSIRELSLMGNQAKVYMQKLKTQNNLI